MSSWGKFSASKESCGNQHHPQGAWHPATPLPHTLVGQFRQWWRRRQWGCGCAVVKCTCGLNDEMPRECPVHEPMIAAEPMCR